jgi:hypothetical protein
MMVIIMNFVRFGHTNSSSEFKGSDFILKNETERQWPPMGLY